MSSEIRPRRPFDAMRRALGASDEGDGARHSREAGDVRVDPERAGRTGIPEVVLAETKSDDQVITSLTRLARSSGRAIASRCSAAMLRELPDRLRSDGFDVVIDSEAMSLVVARPGHPGAEMRASVAVVGVITAGTSDIRVAAEAGLIATEMGCEAVHVRDVGVAGIHRLARPLEALMARGPGAIIVAAGMDGALPSVVAGLVDVPVIGLPTSVGYGAGGRGEAALLSMLQSCSLGLVVVNIDNGIGAGAAAARIALQRHRPA